MTWSDRFAAYLRKRGMSQLDAVFALRDFGVKVTPSKVHYWCNGSSPREETRSQIAKWSKGAVPAQCARKRTGTDD